MSKDDNKENRKTERKSDFVKMLQRTSKKIGGQTDIEDERQNQRPVGPYRKGGNRGEGGSTEEKGENWSRLIKAKRENQRTESGVFTVRQEKKFKDKGI